jgi:hypothetical protein
MLRSNIHRAETSNMTQEMRYGWIEAKREFYWMIVQGALSLIKIERSNSQSGCFSICVVLRCAIVTVNVLNCEDPESFLKNCLCRNKFVRHITLVPGHDDLGFPKELPGNICLFQDQTETKPQDCIGFNFSSSLSRFALILYVQQSCGLAGAF